MLVAEVSNMGCTAEAVDFFIENHILFAPGKAVNAGGVACSGLEMTQNAMHISWSNEEVDRWLHQIMGDIHEQCVLHGKDGNYINYVKGANIAGFSLLRLFPLMGLLRYLLQDKSYIDSLLGFMIFAYF